LPVHRRRGTIRLLKEGRPHEAQILISAATGAIAGERLCFLMLEDLTELVTLRSRLESRAELEGMVGKDPGMRELFETIREVADSPAPVLVLGESGTGKEMVAKAIHNQSARATGHFVAVNCGALPEGLLESELFGHVKGAFTGAIRDKKGRFELADKGTLFLDEIAELSLPMQVKLLRVLQDGSFNRVGDEVTRRADVRLICATNRDLRREVAAGRFREDLYYRLAVVPIQVPPLRERPADIPVLADHLLSRIAEEHGRELARPAPEALALLIDHRWPGNVRELGNVLEYAFIKSKGGVIAPEHLPPALRALAGKQTPKNRRRRKLDRQAVERALERTDGNKVMAAKQLGVSRATLYRFFDSEEDSEAGHRASS
jgi:transcriptional regulator with PAS, ATPase and Fis domain